MTAPEAAAAVTVGQVAAAITAGRYICNREAEYQAAIAAALTHAALPGVREVRLGARDRLDLLCGTVAIEVKTAGGDVAVLRQLQRYAAHPEITGLVLATTRVAHTSLPDEVGGKPLLVVLLRAGLA